MKCILIIELIWVEKYGKMGENHHSGEISRGGTTTEQSGTGTDIGTGTYCSILTNVHIVAITWSFFYPICMIQVDN